MSDELLQRAYRDIAAVHHWLGDVRYMVNAIRRDALPVRRVLDVGCATGLIVEKVGRRLGVDVIGADIRPCPPVAAPVRIVRANACTDPLPVADVTFCMYVAHHLSEDELIRLIRNVGRYSRRFILLDLVRHPLPLALFRLFLAPFICGIDAEDGRRSIWRSYTPGELRRITATALKGSAATFRQTVAPFHVRQVVDISYHGPRFDTEPQSEILAEEIACTR